MLKGLLLLAGSLGFLLLLQTNPCGPLNPNGTALTPEVATHILVLEGERQLPPLVCMALLSSFCSDHCAFLVGLFFCARVRKDHR